MFDQNNYLKSLFCNGRAREPLRHIETIDIQTVRIQQRPTVQTMALIANTLRNSAIIDSAGKAIK
ncbi:MAG: hypothetical protein PVJ84_09390 [Desulfobacteraceae bacterium]